MDIHDDIKKYLPKYLSGASYTELLRELKAFPENIDTRFYEMIHEDGWLQGDGLFPMPYMVVENNSVHKSRAMVLSNSCDISVDNKRMYESRAIVAPIFNLRKLEELLVESFPSQNDRVTNFISSIRRQEVSSIFYLPVGQGMEEESYVRFDTVNSCRISHIESEYRPSTVFRLSNYGFYILLFKLSVHFARVQESVDRSVAKQRAAAMTH